MYDLEPSPGNIPHRRHEAARPQRHLAVGSQEAWPQVDLGGKVNIYPLVMSK